LRYIGFEFTEDIPMQAGPDPAQMQHLMAIMAPMMALFGIVGAALIIVPFWVIFKKAGLGGPLSLLMLIPFVGIVMLYVLAFSRWKVVPAPEFAGYPPTYPPPGYVPAAAAYPPVQAAPPMYVAPPSDTSTTL
jgi:hypothetical protein